MSVKFSLSSFESSVLKLSFSPGSLESSVLRLSFLLVGLLCFLGCCELVLFPISLMMNPSYPMYFHHFLRSVLHPCSSQIFLL